MHLVIASGGTGGHFYPTLAIGRAFQKAYPSSQVTLLLAGHCSDSQMAEAASYGLSYKVVPSVRIPPGLFAKALFILRYFQCRRALKKILRNLKADAVLGMGSYAAAPACSAAISLGIPLFLHEGNAFMGKTNRHFISHAKAIGLTLPLAFPQQAKGCRSEIVGMPLRDAIVTAAEPHAPRSADYLASLGLCGEDRKTILVFGGSQGARAINELLTATIPLLADYADKIQFIHLTGTDDNAALEQAYAAAGIAAHVSKANFQIEMCYTNCDMVICRAGASSICEVELFQKPLLLIPLPTAMDDHQTFNARQLENADAAVLFPQKTATPEALKQHIVSLVEKFDLWQQRGQRLNALARPDAAERMARLLGEYR